MAMCVGYCCTVSWDRLLSKGATEYRRLFRYIFNAGAYISTIKPELSKYHGTIFLPPLSRIHVPIAGAVWCVLNAIVKNPAAGALLAEAPPQMDPFNINRKGASLPCVAVCRLWQVRRRVVVVATRGVCWL